MPKQNHTEAQLTCLFTLALRLDRARQDELEAKTERVKLECQIEAAIECPEEGQVTIRLPNGSSVCVKRSLIYKADIEAIQGTFSDINSTEGVFDTLPCPLKSSTKIELDKDGYAWYKKNYPDIFGRITQHVTVKPAKTSITRK